MAPPDQAAFAGAWVHLLAGLGGTRAVADETLSSILERYREPQRHYHTIDHIRAVLTEITDLSAPDRPPTALLLAGWLHDVVYDPRATNNEDRSAAYARELLQRLDVDSMIGDTTARLILLTKHHDAAPNDREGQILLDADLAILGTAPAEYDRYAAAIRREYSWVLPDAYRVGRTRVLQDFLQRPRIYSTPKMWLRAESRARDNLRREIAALTPT